MERLFDPALHSAGLAALEAALNRGLSLAPAGKSELTTLSGRVFALECESPPFIAYLQPQDDGSVRLMSVYEGTVATRIRGSAGDFAELAGSQDPASTLINGSLELVGDSAPLLELQAILGRLDVDWEAPLVDTFGDVAGHQVAQIARNGFSFGKRAGVSLSRQLDEFIHEEARLSPPRLELEDFYRDVQDLNLQVDRLDSRIKRLRKRLDQAG